MEINETFSLMGRACGGVIGLFFYWLGAGPPASCSATKETSNAHTPIQSYLFAFILKVFNYC